MRGKRQNSRPIKRSVAISPTGLRWASVAERSAVLPPTTKGAPITAISFTSMTASLHWTRKGLSCSISQRRVKRGSMRQWRTAKRQDTMFFCERRTLALFGLRTDRAAQERRCLRSSLSRPNSYRSDESLGSSKPSRGQPESAGILHLHTRQMRGAADPWAGQSRERNPKNNHYALPNSLRSK